MWFNFKFFLFVLSLWSADSDSAWGRNNLTLVGEKERPEVKNSTGYSQWLLPEEVFQKLEG